MKKIILSTLPIFLFASSDNEALLKRIELLEKELNNLKTIVKEQNSPIPINKFQKLEDQVNLNTEDLTEIYPIIENNEQKSILDKVNFSPELELRIDKMSYKNTKIDGENTKIYNHSNSSLNGKQRRDEFSKNFDVSGYVRFRLNMDAKINDKVKFNGRMVFSTSTQTNERLCILSRDIKSTSSNSAFDIDRAYIDYTPNKDSKYATTFSFGLLPTTGGTPMQFAQDAKRKSLFPALVFNMNTYGIIGSQKLTNDNFLRIVLAKAYTMRATFYPYQCNRENIDNATIAGIYYDTKVKVFGDTLLSFGLNSLLNLKAHPYLGADIDANDSSVLGNMFTLGFGIDIKKFIDTDTTIFFHSAMSIPKGNDKVDDYQIINQASKTTASGNTGFSEANYAKGEMLKENGYSVYIGGKYNYSSVLSFGAEYNYGSKYWFSATQGAEDIFNKLATRGSVGEAYAIWNYYKNLSAKFGYMYSKENYTGSGWHFGEPSRKDATQSVGYISLKAKF